MKKCIVITIFILLTICHSCFAEGLPTEYSEETYNNVQFDASEYTYEELLAIKQMVDDEIEEQKRQYAIENGNRKISFDIDDAIVFSQRTLRLKPTVTRITEDAPNNTYFNWSSSDPAIAKVSGEGVVTGVSAGEVQITCTAKDDEYIFATINVQVVLPVKKLSMSSNEAILLLNEDPEAGKMKLSVSIDPADAFCQLVSWKSSNTQVVTVDENGNLQAVGPGTATITATSQEEVANGVAPKTTTCKVTVRQAVTQIELNETDIALSKGKGITLKATVSPNNATKKTVKWTSSDPSVATVSTSGYVTGIKNGTCYIVCTAEDGSQITTSCKVTVSQLVTSINIESGKTTYTLVQGSHYRLNYSVLPADATNKKLKWKSSNSLVASINEYGAIDAYRAGECTITCTAEDGSGKTDTIKIVVESKQSLTETGYGDCGTSYGTRWFKIEMKNTSTFRTIDGYTIRYYGEDVYGNRIKYFGETEIEEIITQTIRPGVTIYTPKIDAYGLNDAKYIYIAIVKVHYTDGTTISYENNITWWHFKYD